MKNRKEDHDNDNASIDQVIQVLKPLYRAINLNEQ